MAGEWVMHTANRLFRTSTRSSSSMYSQMRLYSVCMMSGALQKNSGVSSTVLSRFTAARWMNTWQGARSPSSPASGHALLKAAQKPLQAVAKMQQAADTIPQ